MTHTHHSFKDYNSSGSVANNTQFKNIIRVNIIKKEKGRITFSLTHTHTHTL